MQCDETRGAVVGGSLRRQSLDQRGIVVGTTSNPGIVFRFANGTEHDSKCSARCYLAGCENSGEGSTQVNNLRYLALATTISNGIYSKLVTRLKSRKRWLFSACVSRRTRSVPSSSTLKEAITEPKIIARRSAPASTLS